MQHDLQTRQSPHGAGLVSNRKRLGGRIDYAALAGQPSSRLTANASSRPIDVLLSRLDGVQNGKVDDSPLVSRALLIHCADVLDTVVGTIARGVPIGQCGRGVIAHVADRLRAVAEVLK